jgi:hypothetical protein
MPPEQNLQPSWIWNYSLIQLAKFQVCSTCYFEVWAPHVAGDEQPLGHVLPPPHLLLVRCRCRPRRQSGMVGAIARWELSYPIEWAICFPQKKRMGHPRSCWTRSRPWRAVRGGARPPVPRSGIWRNRRMRRLVWGCVLSDFQGERQRGTMSLPFFLSQLFD